MIYHNIYVYMNMYIYIYIHTYAIHCLRRYLLHLNPLDHTPVIPPFRSYCWIQSGICVRSGRMIHVRIIGATTVVDIIKSHQDQ